MPIDREATLKNAEKFLRVGRLDAAIAEYVRVVDDQPKDWNTANTLGDLYMRAGQSGQAVPLYARVADHLLTEGFYPKAAALFKKILKITPDDEDAQLRLAEISARQGLMADARAYYTSIEKRRRQAGDAAGADEIIVRLGSLNPEDLDARLAAARASERGGRLMPAALEFRKLYDEFLAQGREEEAFAALRDCVRCNPEEVAANRLPLARIELREGRFDEARGLLAALAASDESSVSAVVELGWQLVEASPEAAAHCIEVAADVFLAAGAFDRAAAVLQEFAMRAPARVATLLKLVEVCVDGDLEVRMFEAQVLLADAYLATGNAAEARVIAEDLVARDPRSDAHVDRLRRALVALNVDDVEAVIAERVAASDQEAEVIEDELPPAAETVRAPAPEPVRAQDPPVMQPEVDPPVIQPPAGAPAIQQSDERPPEPPARGGSVEIDLTQLLGELQGQAVAPEVPVRPARDLEEVFSEIRDKAEPGQDDNASGEHFELAKTYLEMGMPQEAVGSLQVAANDARYRFAAAAMLGEIHRDEGDVRAAIEWFERAAEAPAPLPEAGFALLYDLGDLLETVGETARALAIFLELDADAPGYRDVSNRVTRLSRVETEG